MPSPYDMGPWDFWFKLLIKARAFYRLNQILQFFPEEPICNGLIFYDSYDTHFMGPTHYKSNWDTGGQTNNPWLPIFSINNSVGSWLYENYSSVEVSGYLDQKWWNENNGTGVESYDVVGYRNISNSPNNGVVIISNRIDGWWGETPGDSGVGGAIVIGIAKYFQDNNIIPKYDLTFLFTTGEEYGMRGANYYAKTFPKNETRNYLLWIGMDQLAFNQSDCYLTASHNNDTIGKIVSTIINETNYYGRTGYKNETTKEGIGGTDGIVWKDICNSVAFHKSGPWTGYHRAGMNYTEGDSLKNIDRNDTNITFELAWNVTKYFTVDPNCWFSNVTFEAIDSLNDGDTLPDSIRANFTLNTIMPNDKVMVALYYFENGEKGAEYQYYSSTNYTIGSGGVNKSIIFTIPDDVAQGDYTIRLKLYNSTGRINYIVGIEGNQVNDTDDSGSYHLYHPFGYPDIGATSQSVPDRITGSTFTANEYGTADNITAYLYISNQEPEGKSKCMIYRSNDSAFIGVTEELMRGTSQEGEWITYNFSDPKPTIVNGVEYVLVYWGERGYLYYDNFTQERGRYYNFTYFNGLPASVNFTNESRLYSIYCAYTPESTPPEITDVSDNPDPVGFGFNVTINANVTDSESGVDEVKVSIGYPGILGRKGNFTMDHISGNQYQYVFSSTWLVGQYNYTIWATDKNSNINSSTNHSFNVSAQATISIATLKDSYVDDEYINITDPPDPLEDYYIIDRGLTWDKYYNATTGQNVLEVSTGPINYQDENEEWQPINCSLKHLDENDSAYIHGYRIGNEHGLFNLYFKPNIQDDWTVAFAYNKSTDPVDHVVRSKLLGIGYLDPSKDWRYEYLQRIQGSQGIINDNSATYEDVFTGTDIMWTYGASGLKEEIIMSNATKALVHNNQPSEFGLSNEDSYLVFITEMDYQNLNMHNSSNILTGNFTVSEGRIDFKDAFGNFKCALPVGDAYELNDETVRHRLTYRILQYNGEYYLLSGLRLSDLNDMTFPVVIDPTLTVYSTTSDGYIYYYNNSYNSAWTSPTGIVSSSSNYIYIGQKRTPLFPPPGYDYRIYRGFLFFNTSSLPSNAYIDNATLSLYKYSDYSSPDFDITVQNGQPTYPHDPLQTGDYDKSHYSGNGGSLNTANFQNGRNNIYLTNYSWLTKEGMTKFCLRSSRDINGNSPTGSEYVSVYSSEKIGSTPDQYTPKLAIMYRNQSKIKNTGSTNISGYLLIQVQYNDSGNWMVDNDTVNETTPRTINSGSQFALDTIFNGLVNTNDLTNGDGTYRVYAAFRDDDGDILQCDDDTYLVATWEFTVTF